MQWFQVIQMTTRLWRLPSPVVQPFCAREIATYIVEM